MIWMKTIHCWIETGIIHIACESFDIIIYIYIYMYMHNINN